MALLKNDDVIDACFAYYCSHPHSVVQKDAPRQCRPDKLSRSTPGAAIVAIYVIVSWDCGTVAILVHDDVTDACFAYYWSHPHSVVQEDAPRQRRPDKLSRSTPGAAIVAICVISSLDCGTVTALCT